MKNLKEALEVLKILEKNKYESYLVGGVVRDFVLKRPFNDIDITTVATPKEVLGLFRGFPTGVKYGTVTIKYKSSEFEVTTFRTEDGYEDFRRPNQVNFETDVLKDVLRRDFTINGLLMNKDGKVIDHVNGLEDLENQIIKTIGNPTERFNEDALRMMRAFYFESKLNFKIADETREGITKNKKLIEQVSSERVLEELNKILKEENSAQAFKSMVETKIHENLPGLKAGIEVISNANLNVRPIIFFALSFYLNNNIIPSYWKLSNKFRHQIRQVIELLNIKNNFTKVDLFNYGLNNCLDANYINFILNKDKERSHELKIMFKKLPINSSLDLKFRAKDILDVTGKKAGAWVNNLINEITVKVINDELKNDYEMLKTYVLNNYER